jgi:hypothetical protein
MEGARKLTTDDARGPVRGEPRAVDNVMISAYIAGLEALLAEHGDHPLVTVMDEPCLLPCFVDEQRDDIVPAFVMDGN